MTCLQKVLAFTRCMGRKLSCMRAEDVQVPLHRAPQGGEGSSRQARHTNRPEGSCSRAKADKVDEDTSDEDFDDPTYGQEVVGGSQMFDAPDPTQT
jgi:hypothetical protein